jgi:uncharacterized cupin superfamily protein
MAAASPALARARQHPRTGAPLEPVVTRLDLFLAAFSPAAAPAASGLRIAVPPVEQVALWGLSLRRALRELVLGSFAPSPRLLASMDPVGPRTDRPARGELPPLADLTRTLPAQGDPAQLPADPRLWLVLAPPLATEIELMFLPTFLRAEPYARVARAPLAREAGWLEGEVAALAGGRELARHGLVQTLGEGEPRVAVTYKDAQGQRLADITMLEASTGLEDMYAWKTIVEPGQCYARLHSHTASEEIYLVQQGRGLLRVNERSIPVKAGDVFGKPRGYACATQIVNSGTEPLVLLDFGTMNRGEVDLCHYPEHGELLARCAGHRWMVASDALRPGAEFFPLYDRRYQRTSRPVEGS